MLAISSLLVAFASHSLISPNRFTIGGVAGIAILLNHTLHLPQSLLVFCLNLPLVIWSFFYVKRKFAVLSAANIGLQTLWLLFFEKLLPNFRIQFEGNGEKIFAAIATGLCIGTAIVLAFKVGGSTGGGDILALIVQKKFKASSIAWALFFTNCGILVASLFVFYDGSQTLGFNLLPIMMSAFESFIESKTIERINNGMLSAVEFRIITDKPDEMATALMRELSRGVTMLPAKGMYTKADHPMLLCVITNRQIVTLKRIMKEIDPDSFAVMANVTQVFGLGFYQDESDS
jgi:uncharacterized membrane-anchored protein YitT (DUF2179 family)